MKKGYALLIAFSSCFAAWGQTLTLSSSGETGTSGTNWSLTGSNPKVITVTGVANINVSVVNAALASDNLVINGPAEDIILANSITKSASSTTTTLTIKSNRDFIMNSGAGINGVTGGAMNTVIWVDADGNTTGGVALRSVDTKGGHLYVGGGSSSTTWNGLTVPNDGAQDPNFVYTYGTPTVITMNSPITWYASNTLATGGGHVVLWVDDKGDMKFLSHSTNTVNAGTGDITLKTQLMSRHSGNPAMRTTGSFAFVPGGSGVSFSFNQFFELFSFPLTLTNFTWGVPGNYEYVDVTSAIGVTGDVTICSRDIQWYVNWTTPNGSFYIYTFNQVDPINSTSMNAPNGSINIIPASGGFTGTMNIPVGNLAWNAPVVNFGTPSNSTDVQFLNNVSITSSSKWNVWANNIYLAGNNTFSSAGADVVLKATNDIRLNASKSLLTNGGDIILWADSDNNGSGGIVIQNNGILDTRTAADRTAATNTTGGGNLILAGGLDDGGVNSGTNLLMTGLVSGDGYPDGYAANYGGAAFEYGLLFGTELGGGSQNTNIKIYTGGGNFRAHGRVSNQVGTTHGTVGFGAYQGLMIDAGTTGNIDILGRSNPASGVSQYTSAIDLSQWRNSSQPGNVIRTVNGTIRIVGKAEGASGGNIGLMSDAPGGASSWNTIAATGTGNIYMEGQANVWNELRFSGTELFSGSGEIRLVAPSGGMDVSTVGGDALRLGSRSGSAYVSSSSANVVLQLARLSLSRNLEVYTTGSFNLEPYSTSFSGTLTFPTSKAIFNGISSMTVGKAGNAANITVSVDPNASCPLTFSTTGTLTLNSNLTTSAGSITLNTNKALGGLSSARSISTPGSFVYQPSGTSFDAALSYPIANLSVTSNGLTLGKAGNTANITLPSALSITGPVELHGGTVTVSSGLSADGDVTVSGTQFAVNGNVTTSSGGDLVLNAANATVAAGTYLEIAGDVTNNGALTLAAENASDGAYAQMKFGGTWNPASTGSVTVQQYLENGRHLIAAPFTSAQASVFSGTGVNAGAIGLDANNLYNLFGWGGNDWQPVSSGTEALVPGKGYIANVGTFTANNVQYSNGVRTQEGLVGFTGTTPVKTLTVSLTDLTANSAVSVDNSGSLGKRGWNLVANPFTCSMNSTAFTTANNMKGAVYRWNPKSNGNLGQYHAHSPAGNNTDDAIAPLQAFWVQTNNAQASVNLDLATHGTVSQAPVYRKTGDFEADRLRLNAVRNNDPSFQDEAYIALAEGTNDGFDDAWDAHELNSGSEAVYLYTYVEGEASMANNAIPYTSNSIGDKSVPLAFRAPGQGAMYTLDLDQSLSSSTYDVFLEDHHTGIVHNLTESSYTFANETSLEKRFTVRLRSEKTREFNTMGEDAHALNVWVRNGQLVFWMDQLGVGSWTLIGVDGRDQLQGALKLDGTRVQEVALPSSVTPGVYFVRARYNNGNTTFTRIVLQ